MAKDIADTSLDENRESSDLTERSASATGSESSTLEEARELAYSRAAKHDNNSQSSEHLEQQTQRNGTQPRKPHADDATPSYARSADTTNDANLPNLQIQAEVKITSVSEIRGRREESQLPSMIEKVEQHISSGTSAEGASEANQQGLFSDAGLSPVGRRPVTDTINAAASPSISPMFMISGETQRTLVQENLRNFSRMAALPTASSTPEPGDKQAKRHVGEESKAPSNSELPSPSRNTPGSLDSILPIKKQDSGSSSPQEPVKAPSEGARKEKPLPGIGSFINNLIKDASNASECPGGCDDKGKNVKPTRHNSPEQDPLPSIVGKRNEPGHKSEAAPSEPAKPSLTENLGRIISGAFASSAAKPTERPITNASGGLTDIIGATANAPAQTPVERRGNAPENSVGNALSTIISPELRRSASDNSSVLPTVQAPTQAGAFQNALQNIISHRPDSTPVSETPRPSFKESILPILQDLFNNKDRAPQVEPQERAAIIEPRAKDQQSPLVTEIISNTIVNAAMEQQTRSTNNFIAPDLRGQSEWRTSVDARSPLNAAEQRVCVELTNEPKLSRNVSEHSMLSSHIVSVGVSLHRGSIDGVHIAPIQLPGTKAVEQPGAGPVKLSDLNSNPDTSRTAAESIKQVDILKHAGLPSAPRAFIETDKLHGSKPPQAEIGIQSIKEIAGGRNDQLFTASQKGQRDAAALFANGQADNRLLGPGGKQVESLANQIPLAELGDKTAGAKPGSHKDVNEKKDEFSSEKATIVLAGTKKRRDEKLTDSKRTPDRKSNNEPQIRRKYAVRPGDTLQSIARIQLADERFALLLEMINRGNLHYKFEDNVRKVVLRVGQNIWLPTAAEMKVHRTLFFTDKNSKQLSAEPETSLLNAPTQIHHEPIGTVKAEPTNNLPDERFEEHSSFLESISELPKPKVIRKVTRNSRVAPKAVAGESTRDLNSILHAIRHAGHRASADFQMLPELSIFDSNENIAINSGVESSVTTENKGMEANNTFDMLSRIFEQQNTAQKLPTEQMNISDVLKRMRESAAANRPAQFENTRAEIEPQIDTTYEAAEQKKAEQLLVQINHTIRITMTESSKDRATFEILLQASMNNTWTTIASYESNRGRTARFLFRQKGGRQEFGLQLPQFVVRNMAIQDFTRNHQNYIAQFLGDTNKKASTI